MTVAAAATVTDAHASSDALTFTLPTPPIAGDILIVQLVAGRGGVHNAPPGAWNSNGFPGWTVIRQQSITGGGFRQVMVRTCAVGESGTYTFTGDWTEFVGPGFEHFMVPVVGILRQYRGAASWATAWDWATVDPGLLAAYGAATYAVAPASPVAGVADSATGSSFRLSDVASAGLAAFIADIGYGGDHSPITPVATWAPTPIGVATLGEVLLIAAAGAIAPPWKDPYALAHQHGNTRSHYWKVT